MNSARPVQIYSAGNLQEASLLVHLLSREGIRARVGSDSLVWVAGEVPAQLVGVPVWVEAADEEPARDVIRRFEIEQNSAEREQELFCYHCGVPLERATAECPSCGAELDWSQEG